MPTLSRTFAPLAFAGCLLLPQGAMALEVGRCNIPEDGMFRTVLIVRLDGQTHIHRPGQDGLTRRILFNADAAAEWAVARHGAGPARNIAACIDDGRDVVLADKGDAAVVSDPVAAEPGDPQPVDVEDPPKGEDSGSGGTSLGDQL